MNNIMEEYPWSEWNRYIFATGDGANKGGDTKNEIVPILKKMDYNFHCYFDISPGSSSSKSRYVSELEEEMGDNEKIFTSEIQDKDDIIPNIRETIKRG
jgi:uncharacterized sporulation protein YeaH/YhbH (DUF444 family)